MCRLTLTLTGPEQCRHSETLVVQYLHSEIGPVQCLHSEIGSEQSWILRQGLYNADKRYCDLQHCNDQHHKTNKYCFSKTSMITRSRWLNPRKLAFTSSTNNYCIQHNSKQYLHYLYCDNIFNTGNNAAKTHSKWNSSLWQTWPIFVRHDKFAHYFLHCRCTSMTRVKGIPTMRTQIHHVCFNDVII